MRFHVLHAGLASFNRKEFMTRLQATVVDAYIKIYGRRI
jgi:hypothetical protein